MNVRISSVIVIAALAGAAACKSNPLADGAGTPVKVLVSYDTLAFDAAGLATAVQAVVVDSRLTPLPASITFSLCGPAGVATVAVDGNYHPVPNTSAQAIVTAVASGETCVQAASSGLSPATIDVTVN
jgi:hypothetical protein